MWEISDEALLAGYATGDPDAAAVFVRRFQRRAVGLAWTITRDRMEAEEVAQDAFVRAWRYAASFDPRRGSVSTWLLRIVRNTALDRLRVTGRRRELVIADLATTEDAQADPTSADHDVAESDDVWRVAASLHALPPEQRDTLLAVAVHGYSARELSEVTHVPLGTVKTRIRLGMRKMRELVGVAT